MPGAPDSLPGRLVLRPRKRLKMSEPVPVEPVLVVDGPDLGSVVVPQVPEGQVEEGTSDAATTVEIRDAALFAEGLRCSGYPTRPASETAPARSSARRPKMPAKARELPGAPGRT